MAHDESAPASRLSALEVASRLGVKVETVYAYVSRGHLRSWQAADGRTSTFDATEVERLARRGRPRRSTRGPAIDVIIETALTQIDGQHLRYRGHDAVQLATTASFEQVADLLWSGALGDRGEPWPVGPPLALEVSGGLLERLRLAVAVAGAVEGADGDGGDADSIDTDAVIRRGRHLIAVMVGALPVRGSGAAARLRLAGGGPALADTVAARMAAKLVPGRSSAAVVGTVNAALVLLADHELASSTLAARVAASTRAGADAVVSAGLGPLAGPLHGTASRDFRRLLDDAARTSPAAAVVAARAGDRTLPGLGHPLYRGGDPRAAALLDLVRGAGLAPARMRLVDATLGEIRRHDETRPNIDFALGALGLVTGMAPDAGEAIFTVARTAGWIAHALEEYQRTPLRFRVRARYVGPS